MVRGVQLQRAMRTRWRVVPIHVAMLGLAMFWAAPAAADSAPPPDASLHPGFTMRFGLQHTRVRNGEPSSSGYGPRLELEPTLHPIEFLSIGAFLAYSRYSSALYHDLTSNIDRDGDFNAWALGGRIYLHPHWRAFVGVAVYNQWETADLSVLDGTTSSYSELTAQVILGANLVRWNRMLLQIAGTYASWDRSGGGDVTVYGVVLGVHGE